MSLKKISPLLVAAFLVACGDTVENVNQTGVDLFSSDDDLPKCTKDNESELAVVKGETSIRVCMDGEWVSMAPGISPEDFDLSCKTVELKDKSGLKIVCNGDSVGVVYNGKDGKQGEKGEKGDDGDVVADTAVADSERVPISLDSLVGYTQKGPFLKGSTVYLYELSDGRTLKQTNGNFTSKITRDDGRYKFTARDLVSQYAMVVVDGYYRNEVTGKASNAAIRLSALTDMRKRSSVNVNLMTHMEFDRVYYLVTREKMTVKKAKRQAQDEILAQFHIKLDDNTDAEDMDVFGDSDADAALLAVSILLQRDDNETALSVLLTEISNDIVEFGEWKDTLTKTKIADWAMEADIGDSSRLGDFRGYVDGWHLGESVPEFEKYIRNYWYTDYGLGACTKNRNGDVLATKDSLSKYFETTVRFICRDELWVIASTMEKDFYDSEKAKGGKDGELWGGPVTDTTYKYDESLGEWVFATDNDIGLELGHGCTVKRQGEVLQAEDEQYYICDNSDWRFAETIEYDTYERECSADSVGYVITGNVSEENRYMCRNYGESDYRWMSLVDEWSWEVPKEAYMKAGHSYETFKDTRDGKVYRIVTVGTQTWMAENLNYADSVKTPSLVGQSWCRDNNPKYCNVGGRYYTWLAAQHVCPMGWHLPSLEEFKTLADNVGGVNVAGMNLRTQVGWNEESNGRDSVGFSALPVGHWHYEDVDPEAEEPSNGWVADDYGQAIFWSSENEGDFGFCMNIFITNEFVSINGIEEETCYTDVDRDGYSVRCIQD